MISWDLITQIDTFIDPQALGACGSQLKERQAILHAWIGRRRGDFNRPEWVLFCRTALVIWKAVEEAMGPVPPITRDDLQVAGARRSQQLSHQLGTWPEDHLASAILSWIGDYDETDLVMFAGFKYHQALNDGPEPEVRSETGVLFLLKAWIMLDAILMAAERGQAKETSETSRQAKDASARSDSLSMSEIEDKQM